MAEKILQHKPQIPLHEIPVEVTREELHQGLDWILDSNTHYAKDVSEYILNTLLSIRWRG